MRVLSPLAALLVAVLIGAGLVFVVSVLARGAYILAGVLGGI